MSSLVALAIFLVAITYFLNSGRPIKQQSRVHGQSENLFRGRHTHPPPRSNTPVNKGDMLRCHNCATFFPEGRVINVVVEGHVLEFCSHNCKRNFLAGTPH